MADDLSRLFERTARAAEASPDFLAAVFARYRDAECVDEADVARRLGVAADRLSELALCLRPRPVLFRQDVEAIAARFGIDAAALAGMIRHVDALDAFALPATPRMLTAARDAEDDRSPEDEP
ncbi:MAG TPA: hypothetical protein VH482_05010 [Thermomicrobiales bacterium]